MFKATHYCYLMYRTSEIWILKYTTWSCKIYFSSSISMESSLKKAKVKLDLLTDIDMLLMVGKGIGGGICHSIYQYAKTNNKYMKDYCKNKESYVFAIGM